MTISNHARMKFFGSSSTRPCKCVFRPLPSVLAPTMQRRRNPQDQPFFGRCILPNMTPMQHSRSHHNAFWNQGFQKHVNCNVREHAKQIEAATTARTTPSLGRTQPHLPQDCILILGQINAAGQKTGFPAEEHLSHGSQTLPKSTSSSKGFEKVSHGRASASSREPSPG